MSIFSRRDLLRRLGVAAAGRAMFSSGMLSKDVPPLADPNPGPLFVEIPPSASGITWKHTNGRSPGYYLPETTGAGCAFLDYDNDGWMDIYLVNSGKCDFFDPQPPLRHAHPISAAPDARLPGDVGEGAIAVVVIEGVAERRIWDGRGGRRL